jgi:hypothetical protein
LIFGKFSVLRKPVRVLPKTSYGEDLTGFENLSGFRIAQTPFTHTIAILPSAIEAFE